jgi:hypothetical protein
MGSGERHPWWRPPVRPGRPAWLGPGYLALALAFLAASFFISSPVIAWMFAGLWLITGLWYLLSRAVARRREQRPPESGR